MRLKIEVIRTSILFWDKKLISRLSYIEIVPVFMITLPINKLNKKLQVRYISRFIRIFPLLFTRSDNEILAYSDNLYLLRLKLLNLRFVDIYFIVK